MDLLGGYTGLRGTDTPLAANVIAPGVFPSLSMAEVCPA